MTETRWSWKEMMAIFFARQIEDGDTLCSGAHTEISFCAAMLAQKSHAPNLRLQLGGTGYLCNLAGRPVLGGVPKTSVDYRIAQWAEAYFDHPETFIFYGPPGGGRRYYEDRSAFEGHNGYFFADHFFVGGLQVDYHGNVNLIGLGADGAFTVRGPGSVGIGDVITVRNMFVFMTAHDPRRFVPKVDYISTMGPSGWREKQFPGNGPQWIVSPLGVFDFTGEGMTARLRGVFPGHTEDEVAAATGFPVARSELFGEIEPPSAGELALLREQVDVAGVLGGIPGGRPPGIAEREGGAA
jgi:glutaconate CoA-transferase subunit B